MKLPSNQNLAELDAAVRSRVGFDPQSVGDQSLLRAVCQRMKEGRVSDGNDYVALLLKDEAEFDAFVEDLLVPETWFFRDRQPFRCIQHYATQCWRPSRPGDRLRILSLPCSTGEEPYSIAMALLDMGLMPSQFQIDGADLSRRALLRATQAVYGKFSFRGDEAAFPGLCDRFLDRQGDSYVANAQLRGTVRFLQDNLVSPSLLEGQPKYHIVLCRNVLIYLDAEARRTALASLHRLLLPEGLLYVGHVEARVATEGAFCRFSAEFPFAFSPRVQGICPEAEYRPPETPPPPATGRDSAGRRRMAVGASTTDGSANAPPARLNRVSPGSDPPGIPKTRPQLADAPIRLEAVAQDLALAEKLAASQAAANEGRLDEATALCRDVLAKDQANVDALCLLGLVAKVRSEVLEAERCFQKALYVDPRHEEALIHMMMLAQQRGDERAAANFRRRAEQARQVGG